MHGYDNAPPIIGPIMLPCKVKVTNTLQHGRRVEVSLLLAEMNRYACLHNQGCKHEVPVMGSGITFLVSGSFGARTTT